MARLELMPEQERKHLENLECQPFETHPWVEGPPLIDRRVAIVSTAGLHRPEDRPFTFDPGEIPENPRDDIALAYTLNLATDDLKAYYFEAITAQSGQESPSSESLSDWFYNDTLAGKVLYTLGDICKNHEDGLMKLLGTVLIIPAAQVSKTKE